MISTTESTFTVYMLKYGDLLSGLCEVGDEGQVCGSPHPV